MIALMIIASAADAFLVLISALSIIGGRLNTEERNAMLFCLFLAIINLLVIWGQI